MFSLRLLKPSSNKVVLKYFYWLILDFILLILQAVFYERIQVSESFVVTETERVAETELRNVGQYAELLHYN